METQAENRRVETGGEGESSAGTQTSPVWKERPVEAASMEATQDTRSDRESEDGSAQGQALVVT